MASHCDVDGSSHDGDDKVIETLPCWRWLLPDHRIPTPDAVTQHVEPLTCGCQLIVTVNMNIGREHSLY